jgi:hypothetical protein
MISSASASRPRQRRLPGRRVQIGQRPLVAGTHGVQQVTGGLHRPIAPAEQQLPVLPVQGRPSGRRDQVVDGATQQRVAEAAHVPGDGHDLGRHGLLDDRR